jgi:hypothetical protein
MGKTFPAVCREAVNSILLVNHGKTVKDITYDMIHETRSVLPLNLKEAIYHWNKYLKCPSDM